MIAVIDSGIDYLNPIFRNGDVSRIAYIWDQTIPGNEDEQVPYGKVFTGEEINQALLSENPQEIVPSLDENGHGTAMAGLAAGNFVPTENFSGAAPKATVQEVLHADWQEVWHSPHPPFITVFCKFFVFRVLICSISLSSLCNYILGIVYHISFHFKSFFLRQHSTQCSAACAHKKCCNCMSCTHIPAAFCHNRDSQQ